MVTWGNLWLVRVLASPQMANISKVVPTLRINSLLTTKSLEMTKYSQLLMVSQKESARKTILMEPEAEVQHPLLSSKILWLHPPNSIIWPMMAKSKTSINSKVRPLPQLQLTIITISSISNKYNSNSSKYTAHVRARKAQLCFLNNRFLVANWRTQCKKWKILAKI